MKFETGVALGVAVLVAAACGWAAMTSAENARLHKQAARQDGCTAYLTTGRAGSQQDCDPVLADLVEHAHKARRCDQALLLGGFSEDCSPIVTEIYGSKLALQAELADAVADRDASIRRAMARTAVTQTRKTNDEQSLAAAPRASDGLIVCNAECLRQRFEAPPH